ncbi:hypothetical protein BgiBS90_003129 [Biomphalaria glabrata]|nr:hypothetical protein BgiBS90_003129 [Biomphalaria glabrata]
MFNSRMAVDTERYHGMNEGTPNMGARNGGEKGRHRMWEEMGEEENQNGADVDFVQSMRHDLPSLRSKELSRLDSSSIQVSRLAPEKV